MTGNYWKHAGLQTGVTPPEGRTNVVNVGRLERFASIGVGISLACSALKQRGFLKCGLLLAGGGYMLYRGISGNCPLSGSLGLSSRLYGRKTAQAVIKSVFTVNRPRNEVYDFWRRLENLPRFMRHLKKVEEKDAKHSRWTAKFPGQIGAFSWDAEITREEEGSLLAWSSSPGSSVSNAGEVKFTDAPGGEGTEVRVDISYRPPAGDLGKGIAKLLNPALEDMIREDIRNFKQYLEAGEVPTVKDQSSGRKKARS